MRISAAPQKIWKTQPPIDYIDNTITISTPETVIANLSGGEPCKLWYIIVEQTNNGATVEDIDLHITINGVVRTITFTALPSGVPHYVICLITRTGATFTFGDGGTAILTVGEPLDIRNALPFRADSVGLITVEQTTAVDVTAASIEVNITWELLEDI